MGFVIWLTGLPGSGKTAIAKSLESRYVESGVPVEVFDGDEVRKWLSPEAGFSKEERERHIRRVAHISRLLSKHDVVVIVSLVSPYRSTREYARSIIDRFVEVYVKCSIDTCIKRDPKGLYRRALAGEIKDMTGIQDSYEEPLSPEVVVDTENQSLEQSVQTVLQRLKKLNYRLPE